MKWHYNIIKDGDEYFLGEVLGKYGWAEIAETRTNSIEDLRKDLYNRWVDSIYYEVLEVKKGKLCTIKNKSKSSPKKK